VTPSAYDAFVASGRTVIPDQGAFIIVQSGGINNSTSNRLPTTPEEQQLGAETGLDYYIDNLKIVTAVNGKATSTSTNATELSFDVYEPYGFNFITKLRNSRNILFSELGDDSPENFTKQFYILGIKFLGWNIDGTQASPLQQIVGPDGNEIELDPQGGGDGLFSHFYDIFITGVKFNLSGATSTYKVSARALPPGEALGSKRGRIKDFIQINTGVDTENAPRTVNDVLQGIVTELNARQAKEAAPNADGNQARDIPNVYRIEYADEESELLIGGSSIVTASDTDKYKFPGAGEESNVSTEQVAVNPQGRVVRVAGDTSIIKAFDGVIKNSAYVKDALETVYTTRPNDRDGTFDVQQDDSNIRVGWYNLVCRCGNAKWDARISDWAWDMTYVIRRYETPIIDSVYANQPSEYPGPHKTYEYWYTGKNTEVLSYNQTLDNLYFNVGLADITRDGTPGNPAKGGPNNIATVPQTEEGDRTGTLQNSGQGPNSYVTSLQDPGSWAQAKMTIMGDPDYLMSESDESLNRIERLLYADDGYTINPNGGQVFYEMNFYEAIDYDNETGVMKINDRIQFWRQPNTVVTDGVSYMLIKVTHKFSSGFFTQDLEAVINTFGEDEGQGPTA